MDGNDLKKRIEDETEGMKIPESLEPKKIEKILGKRKYEKQKRYYKSIIVAAACFVAVIGVTAIGIYGASVNKQERRDSSEQMKAGALEKIEADGGNEQNFYKIEEIKTAKNYKEVYDYIQAEEEQRKRDVQNYNKIYFNGAMGRNEEASTVGIAEDGAETEIVQSEDSQNASMEYSDTNSREQGVAEGDIVKTDGKNLYILNEQTVQIVSIENDTMEAASAIDVGSAADTSVHELYIKDSRLVILYNQIDYGDAKSTADYTRYTIAETYDVSDAKNPRLIGKISQSGIYQSMRAAGDYVYLISDFYANGEAAVSEQARYIPEVQGKLISCGDILMPEKEQGSRYTIVSAFSLKNPGEKTDSKAIFGNTGMSYVSGNNIYICEQQYNQEGIRSETCIRKVAYQDGILTAVGQTKIEGYLKDSFCIDEYQGNLRMVATIDRSSNGTMPLTETGEKFVIDDSAAVTTEEGSSQEKQGNILYILDENLKELSRIEGLAPGEIVYSARFMGDVGYFVTFRQMDPLFSVDLSDPSAPKIIGSLKIPGFSEYLHPYGDGLLLGIGYDVDETGTTNNGVKISMFDVSDPSNVQEIEKYLLTGTYSTEAAYNYKEVFIDVEKNMIGFSAYGEEDNYYIFSYDENGFHILFEKNLAGYISGIRAFYAGDKIYLVTGNTVESFHMGTFDKVDDIVL